MQEEISIQPGTLSRDLPVAADAVPQDLLCKHDKLLRKIITGFGLGRYADDIVQDVYLRAVKNPGRWENAAQIRAWLAKVTVNICMQKFRQQKRFWNSAAHIYRNYQDRQNNNTEEMEKLAAVRESMKQMPDDMRGLLTLKYFCGMDSNEIGDVLDLNPSTVRSRLRKGRLALARELKSKGVGVEDE